MDRRRPRILYDTPDGHWGILVIDPARYAAVAQALAVADRSGGPYLKVILTDRLSGQVVYQARTRQRPHSPQIAAA